MVNNKLRVLTIGAHPDDSEFRVGGTAAKYRANGHTVRLTLLLTLTMLSIPSLKCCTAISHSGFFAFYIVKGLSINAENFNKPVYGFFPVKH